MKDKLERGMEFREIRFEKRLARHAETLFLVPLKDYVTTLGDGCADFVHFRIQISSKVPFHNLPIPP